MKPGAPALELVFLTVSGGKGWVNDQVMCTDLRGVATIALALLAEWYGG